MRDLTRIFYLGSNWWKKEGQKIRGWIISDAKNGIFQNGRGLKSYISEQYKRYKENGMRRFTRGGALKDFDPSFDYPGKRLYGSKRGTKRGEKISGLKGVSVKSTNTSFVDMTLTGRLLEGLHVESANDSGVTMSYNEEDRGKIEGNRGLDREVVGLNEENIEKLRQDVIQEFQKNMSEVFSKDININVKLM